MNTAKDIFQAEFDPHKIWYIVSFNAISFKRKIGTMGIVPFRFLNIQFTKKYDNTSVVRLHSRSEKSIVVTYEDLVAIKLMFSDERIYASGAFDLESIMGFSEARTHKESHFVSIKIAGKMFQLCG